MDAPASVRGTGTPGGLPFGPVRQPQRIASLDVLRGFALFGILVVNIQAFAMVSAAYMNPTAFGDFHGANRLVWLLAHTFFEQKFITLFSMLFGAGMVLMTTRAESSGRSGLATHFRRMLWLILFGLLHAYLLWYGDILVWYGLCGMVVVWFRRMRPRVLIGLGLLSVAVASLLSLLSGWAIAYWPDDQWAEFQEKWQPSAATVAAELEAYRGGWLDQMTHRAGTAWEFQTLVFLSWGLWRAGGVMLIGMALFKLGVLSAERSGRFYLGLAAIGFLVGVPIVLEGVRQQFAHGWGVRYAFFFGSQYNYWASLLVSLGWIGVVMWICQTAALPSLRRGLAAVGQMALTNYLLQTIVCTTIFYGHGLGWFGWVERIGQLAIVVLVYTGQVLFSMVWLRSLRFGPLEWLWRSLTYGRRQPLLRRTGEV